MSNNDPMYLAMQNLTPLIKAYVQGKTAGISKNYKIILDAETERLILLDGSDQLIDQEPIIFEPHPQLTKEKQKEMYGKITIPIGADYFFYQTQTPLGSWKINLLDDNFEKWNYGKS